MKPLFIALASCVCLLTSAQSYQPFPTGEASWKVGRCWIFYPGGVHDEVTFQMDGVDTIINSVSYKKVIMKHRHAPGTAFDSSYIRIMGGMRESNKKVFFVSEDLCGDTIERMVYDFNYENVGDTIYTNVLLFGFTDKVPHVITAIDSVQVGGVYHRRLHLTDTSGLGYPLEWWIEGVGSSWGLGYASYWIITDNSYDLICFNADGWLKYVNHNPGYGFCLSPQPEIECEGVEVPDTGCFANFSTTRNTDTIAFKGVTNLVTINQWQWDFGDNQTGTGEQPLHVFAPGRWYETCLTVSGLDSSGTNCTATKCDSLYISDGCIDSALICPQGSLCCDAPLVDTVCGCNGVNYENACQAQMWYGVMEYTEGACLTGIKDRNSMIKKATLLPNPAGTRTILTVETAEPGDLLVYLKNTIGETLLSHRSVISGNRNSAIELDLENVPAGIYIVEMHLNGRMEVKKLMRE